VVTKGKYFLRPYAWAFQQYSPYLDIFNYYISEMKEKGPWSAIISKYEAATQICPDQSGMPIEFANCFTAFLCLIAGIPDTIRYSTLLYATLRYSTLLYATLRYSTLLYATRRYSTLLYATLRYSTLLYATLRYSTLLYATLCYSRLL
jgi:hypothetical protein